MVNELPGVDRQVVSRDISKLNLSVGITHRGPVERASGQSTPNPDRPCGVTSSNSNARGIMHYDQTETYYIASGSGALVTGGTILSGNAFAPDSNATSVLNGPSCGGVIVGDWIANHDYSSWDSAWLARGVCACRLPVGASRSGSGSL